MGIPYRREWCCDERLQLRARRLRHRNLAGRDLTSAFKRPSRADCKDARGEQKRDQTRRFHGSCPPLAPSLKGAVRLLGDMWRAQLKSDHAFEPIEVGKANSAG